MAEFCLECYNMIHGTNFDKRDLVISKELDHCEHCNSWKPAVVKMKAFHSWLPECPRRGKSNASASPTTKSQLQHCLSHNVRPKRPAKRRPGKKT